MKKIISVILVSIIGLSFVYANDSVVSLIKESKVEDVRTVGSELCRLFLHKDKGYMHQLKDYFFGLEPEEKVAMQLRNLLKRNTPVVELIFSGKASEDSIVRELQEGCFDYLSEEILSLAHGLNVTFTNSNETLHSAVRIYCLDASNNQTVRGSIEDVSFDDSDLMPCTNGELTSHNALTEVQDTGTYYHKLIDSLGIEEDRLNALNLKINAIFNLYNDEDDDEFDEWEEGL